MNGDSFPLELGTPEVSITRICSSQAVFKSEKETLTKADYVHDLLSTLRLELSSLSSGKKYQQLKWQ